MDIISRVISSRLTVVRIIVPFDAPKCGVAKYFIAMVDSLAIALETIV